MPEPPPQLIIGLMGLFMIVLGLAFAGLPSGDCDEDKCAHCRQRRLERAGKWPPDDPTINSGGE